MAETLRQSQAFDYYYSLGENRSYETVAEKFGVSKNSVYNWSKYNHWRERIAKRDAENAKEIFKRTDEDIVDNLVQYRKLIAGSIGSYYKQLKDGVVKITSPSDFIKLVELDVKLAEILKTDHSKNNIDDTLCDLLGRMGEVIINDK